MLVWQWRILSAYGRTIHLIIGREWEAAGLTAKLTRRVEPVAARMRVGDQDITKLRQSFRRAIVGEKLVLSCGLQLGT